MLLFLFDFAVRLLSTRFLGISHVSNASFFYSTELFALETIFSFIHQFSFENLNFLGFLAVPLLIDNYAKIVDKRGLNLMCDCILPILFVFLHFKNRHRTIKASSKHQSVFIVLSR